MVVKYCAYFTRMLDFILNKTGYAMFYKIWNWNRKSIKQNCINHFHDWFLQNNKKYYIKKCILYSIFSFVTPSKHKYLLKYDTLLTYLLDKMIKQWKACAITLAMFLMDFVLYQSRSILRYCFSQQCLEYLKCMKGLKIPKG